MREITCKKCNKTKDITKFYPKQPCISCCGKAYQKKRARKPKPPSPKVDY